MEPKPSAHSAIKTRLVLLGASNLTLGFPMVVNLAQLSWGSQIEIFAALGYGRSYGMPSRVLGRTLSGILQSDLWKHLEKSASRSMPAIITDIGNDILYHVPVPQILDWMTECVRRLQSLGAEVVLIDLPLANFEGLAEWRFMVCRSILVPSCRLSLKKVEARARAVAEGLRNLAKEAKVTLIVPRPEWYGFDPIHMRPSQWVTAWHEILTGGNAQNLLNKMPKISPLEWVKFNFARPEQQWFSKWEMGNGQPALRMGGSRVWLY